MRRPPVFAGDGPLFYARVDRVLGVDKLAVTLELDFGLSLERQVRLGVVRGELGQVEAEAAKHALICTAGGESVWVKPPPGTRSEWGRVFVLDARVFVDRKVYGEPVGWTRDLPGTSRPVLELGPFYSYLLERGFPEEELFSVIRKPRSHGKAV